MTDEEKYQRFLDAQEHPERYTEQQLAETMNDARELAVFKHALMKQRADASEIDVDEAWRAFSTANIRKSHANHLPRPLRIAAAFIGFVLIAGIALAAMTSLGIVRNPFAGNKPAVVNTSAVKPATPIEKPEAASTPTDTIPAKPQIKVFNNAPLSEIAAEMGAYYHVGVAFADAKARSIRLYFEWNRAKSLDENIDILNSFSAITITRSDNTITIE